MDLAELKKRARAARSFEIAREGFTFRGMIPTDLEVRAVVSGAVSQEIASQTLMFQAITGWDGVRIEHLLPDAPPEAAKNGVEYEPDLAHEFFASRGALFYELSAEIFRRINARRLAIESAEKNSASTSA